MMETYSAMFLTENTTWSGPSYDVISTEMVSTTVGNTTDNHTTESTAKRDMANAKMIVLGIILFLAIVENLFVIITLFFRRQKLSRMLVYIFHLSIADLLSALLGTLPELVVGITVRFLGGDFLCKIYKYCQLVSMYASGYVLVMTAVDRYLAICYPLRSQKWSPRKAHMMVAIAWGIILVLSVPPFFIFGLAPNKYGLMDCMEYFVHPEWSIQVYVTWLAFSVWFLPMAILIFTYGRISYVVWINVKSKETPSVKSVSARTSYKSQQHDDVKAMTNGTYPPRTPRAHVQRLSRAKLKTIKLTLTVVIVYAMCWSPFFITHLLYAFNAKLASGTSNLLLMNLMMMLGNLNSCTNPWIYLCFIDGLKNRICRRRQPPPRNNSTFSSTMRSTRMTSIKSSPMSALKHDLSTERNDILLKQMSKSDLAREDKPVIREESDSLFTSM
ncbi:cephalotocin receptor 1 [Lingula anatina]|uniref:Cephalotocin receptor 1 n=1 Tax=Lingula anatina TaxID=7574 RepID=A0A1S3HEB7_LINAN|nr:cephalotocin receptor 1 [Lingula anatina]XP_013384398.1 cephalotocin receptor 1 [Lingula anatina]XP_013384399.1 cephalotocin receptor 1 [Lingula anatina]XP_013384400.1 cephalotocin receptor 1 [Lingula anatina]|eukprot:XP_013384397.1 cephalotocin receptor 1 [Lingula anatina]